MTFRVVLDTNVVVSSLLFTAGRLSWIRQAWGRREFLPLVSSATSRELIRVLAYPKFRLDPADIEALLADYLPFAETVEVSVDAGVLPSPPDPDDRMFLALAVAGKAVVIVTGDERLAQTPGPAGVEIASPERFREMLRSLPSSG